jgi:serine/threonine protein kinase
MTDEKSDIWSCGVILYFLLSGRMPFKGEDQTATLKNIMRGKYNTES